MIISQNWLKEFVDFSCSPQELADILTMLGIEVEKIHDESAKFHGFFVGRVLQREKHPNADKLSVCEVTTDGVATRTIICGAPNVAAGQKVVVALDGAIVPNGGFEIAKRKIRGVESNGMICSKSELGLSEDHSGIWELPEDSPIGQPLAEFLGVNDVLYEIGITPNRADCLSHLGIARDLAAYFSTEVRKPAIELTESEKFAEEIASVEVIDTKNCPRYAGRIVENVQVKESPEWLKNRLIACGLRPRNVIVDITNFVLLECGHPLHAFDFDTIAGKKIVVKSANDGEKFTTLDSKERVLDSSMLMICDSENPIAIAGVMGGENSEITEKTTTVFLESAYFFPSSIRRTSKKLAIQSDASYRFERGTDIENVRYAIDRAAQLMAKLAGGTVARGVIDAYPEPKKPLAISLRYARARQILGAEISNEVMVDLLRCLYFDIIFAGDELVSVLVPTFRVDIFSEIDLVEEVARLFGYDNIAQATASTVSFGTESMPKELVPNSLQTKILTYYRASGFQEIMTQNMISPTENSLFSDASLRLANALGEEMSVMRSSLIPSMLHVIDRNFRFGQKDLRLFEVGKTFHRSEASESFLSGIEERDELLIALTGSAELHHWSGKSRAVDFYDIKGVAETFTAVLGLEKIVFEPNLAPNSVFSPNSIVMKFKKNQIGIAGEISAEVLKKFGIESSVFLCSVNCGILQNLPQKSRKFIPVSAFPTVSRDLAFVVDEQVPAETLRKAIQNAGGEFLRTVQIFDVFSGKSIGEGKKSLAFALEFNSRDKTLNDSDVDVAISAIISAVQKQIGGELRR